MMGRPHRQTQAEGGLLPLHAGARSLLRRALAQRQSGAGTSEFWPTAQAQAFLPHLSCSCFRRARPWEGEAGRGSSGDAQLQPPSVSARPCSHSGPWPPGEGAGCSRSAGAEQESLANGLGYSKCGLSPFDPHSSLQKPMEQNGKALWGMTFPPSAGRQLGSGLRGVGSGQMWSGEGTIRMGGADWEPDQGEQGTCSK